jgi:oligoendopeptidase F
MWAALPHFYIAESSFNNYPYTFGLLFSLGLVAVAEVDAAGFMDAFDTMLSLAGTDDAPTLAARLGIDLRSPAFWQRSVDVIRHDIDRFMTLVQQHATS